MNTAKAMVLAVSLLIGAFAAVPQYGQPLQDGGSVSKRALSDMMQAREIIADMPLENAIRPYQLELRNSLENAIPTLQRAIRSVGMDPNRLPPAAPTGESAPSLVRVKILMDDAHRLLSSGGEYNDDLRARVLEIDKELSGARVSLNKALSIKQEQVK